MSLKTAAELFALGAFAAWMLSGHPFPGGDAASPSPQPAPLVRPASAKLVAGLPAAPAAIDPMVTGSIASAPWSLRLGGGRVVLAQTPPLEAMPEPVTQPEPAVPAAREPAPATPSGAAPQPAAAVAPPAVDESALRYFARNGDTRRLNAEIARLRALYPGWTPPADPTATPVFRDTELDTMWQLFSEGRYGEVRAAIADRQARDPSWVPPASLTELLDQADRRVRLTNASDAGQWATVISIAANTPSLLTCEHVDVLWRVAEAFDKTGRQPRAEDAYRYILENCDSAAERLATVQKASVLLPLPAVDALLKLERGDEFQAVKDDLLRRRIGEIAQTSDVKADPADLKRLQELAASATTADDPMLLGWYDYRRDRPDAAEALFQKALDLDPSSAKAAEGYTLSLVALDKMEDAEAAGYEWNDKSADNLAAYMSAVVGLLALDPPAKLSEPVLKRIVSVVTREKNPAAGEQLGWYAYNVGQPSAAERWFEVVLRWSPDYEPAAYGLAVARLALKDRAGASEIIRAWRDRSDRIAKLAKPSRSDAGAGRPGPRHRQHGLHGRYRWRGGGGAPPRCGGNAPIASLGPAAALARGWCLMDLNRPVEAAEAFEVAMRSADQRTRSDAAYGAALAHLRSGVTDRAGVAAAAALQPPERRKELMVGLLTQQAVAFAAEGRSAEVIAALDERARYAPEQNDLLVLRGFAYLKLGQYSDAMRIFKAVAATGNPDAIRGLALLQSPDGVIH